MEIHVIRRPNVVSKIIGLFVLVHLDLLAIHLEIASKIVLNQDHNVPVTVSVHCQMHASIKFVEIHVSNEIHAVKMLNVEPFNIIQPVTVHLDGQEIHKFSATNVSLATSFSINMDSLKQQKNKII